MAAASECMTGDVFGSLALQDTAPDTYDADLALGHGEDERDYTAAPLNHLTLSLDPILEQAGRGLLGPGSTVTSF